MTGSPLADLAHPVDRVLQRLLALHPKLIDLSLGRIQRLLARLDHPERRLPPVIHAAGTNGKGSTLAFIDAIAAAHGVRSHRYTSPHLVRFNERIALAGQAGASPKPIADEPLLALLDRVEAANGGDPITFFEVTTAAAFLAFAGTPADLVLLETGLGGRVDATNVISQPAVTVITPIGMDHMGFLGDSLAAIAGEKAGIIKPNRPLVLAPQPAPADQVLRQVAAERQAPLVPLAPEPPAEDVTMPGAHQRQNAQVAVTAFRAFAKQAGIQVEPERISQGLRSTQWPARLQRLSLSDFQLQDDGRSIWLDGAHNPEGMAALMAAWSELVPAQPADLVIGLMANKDCDGVLAALAQAGDSKRFAQIIAVPVPDTPSGMPPKALAEALKATMPGDLPISTAPDAASAVARCAEAPARPLLIAGSLYLAGSILAGSQLGAQPGVKRLPLIGV